MHKNPFSLESFESYLNNIGISKSFSFTDKQKVLMENSSIKFIDVPIGKNEALTPILASTLNGIHIILENNTVSFNSLYTEYTKIAMKLSNIHIIYSFPDFVNGLSILEQVLSSFNKDLLKIEFQIVHEEAISIHYMDNSDTCAFSEFSSYLRKKSKDNSLMDVNVRVRNFLFLFFIFSFAGKASFGQLSSKNLFINLNVYNQFYISHYNYGLMIHLGMVIYCNLYNTKNKVNKNDDSKRLSNFIDQKSPKKKKMSSHKSIGDFRHLIFKNKEEKSVVSEVRETNRCYSNRSSENISPALTLYLFDNTIIPFLYNDITKIVTSLNDLKCFLYGCITNNYKFKINITIVNPSIILKTDFSGSFVQSNHSMAIQQAYLNLLFKGNKCELFKYWQIEQLIIEVKECNYLDQIMGYFDNFEWLIGKAQDFHFKGVTNENDSYITVEYFLIESVMLNWIIDKLYYFKYNNKNSTVTQSFKFNTWKMSINKSSSIKNINIYFNYSLLQEKALFNHFISKVNFIYTIKMLMQIIDSLELFKGYNIGIRLFENNFRSQQLDFYIQLIIHLIANHVDEKKLENTITIYERTFHNYIESMHCYIGNIANENIKINQNNIKSAFGKVAHIKYFKFMSSYLLNLSSIFGIVIFSETLKTLRIIRTFDDNYLFCILTTNPKKRKSLVMNTLIPHNLNQFTDDEETEEKYLIQLYVYINKDKESYLKIFPLLSSIKADKNKKCPIEITVIIEKSFLSSIFLSESKLKKLYVNLFEDINHFYLISKPNTQSDSNNDSNNNKHRINPSNDSNTYRTRVNPSNDANSNESYDCDIFFTSTHIRLISYYKYDRANDPKYKKFIYNFIAIISNNIDIMVYILKHKMRTVTRFIFVFKSSSDIVYELDFKNGNLFIKQIINFGNMITMNMNNAIPLLCLFSNKSTSSHTISNENFYDVFVRILLNLNKVSDCKDTLNGELFKKLHKNIFIDYYESFFPIAFSYDAFTIFNDFFLSNDFLSITNGEKFKTSYIIPFDSFTSYKEVYERTMANNIIVFCSDFGTINKETNKRFKYFSFSKLDTLIKELNDDVKYKVNERSTVFGYLKKKIPDHSLSMRVMDYYCKKEVREYYIEKDVIEGKIDQYMKDKENLSNQKPFIRYSHLVEEIKHEKNNGDKNQNCILI